MQAAVLAIERLLDPAWKQTDGRITELAPLPFSAADSSRDVAQPGSALAWGARGREFKSRRPDQSCPTAEEVLRFAQDFASGLSLRSRPLIGSTWGARGREFKSRRPDHLPDFLVPITV